MYLEDLIPPIGPKDTSESCVFDFPDRPPDTLPPDYPPINPPECYPYCDDDDWPPPDFPPTPPFPIVIPPGTTPVAGTFLNAQGDYAVLQFFNDNTVALRIAISGLGVFGNLAGTPIYTDDGENIGTTSRYYGAGGISTDFILQLSATHGTTSRSKFYVVDIPKLFAAFPSNNLFLVDVRMSQVAMTSPPNPPGDWPLQGSMQVSANRNNSTANGISIPVSGFNINTPTPPYTLHAELYITRPNGINWRISTEVGAVIPVEL